MKWANFEIDSHTLSAHLCICTATAHVILWYQSESHYRKVNVLYRSSRLAKTHKPI